MEKFFLAEIIDQHPVYCFKHWSTNIVEDMVNQSSRDSTSTKLGGKVSRKE